MADAISPPVVAEKGNSEVADISNNYETPAPEPFSTFNALKDRIRHHYEICSDYYYSLWYVPILC